VAKTYNTISTFVSGAILTASQMNGIGTNVNNYRVPPTAIAVRTTTSAAYTLNTDITFESATASGGHDTDSMWAGGSPTRLTVTTPGIYLVTFNGYVTMASSGGVQTLVILKNGSSVCETYLPNSGTNHLWSLSHVINLALNDYITVRHTNGGSGAATIYGATSNTNTQTRVGLSWLGQAS